MAKYECPCGYVYEEAVGNVEYGIVPNTRWEEVEADFICPICGIEKNGFVELFDET